MWLLKGRGGGNQWLVAQAGKLAAGIAFVLLFFYFPPLGMEAALSSWCWRGGAALKAY